MNFDEKDKNRICMDKSFLGWYSRKPMYILKLAINRAASESNKLIIEWKHIQQAIADIESVEKNMGLVFRAIGKSDVAAEVDTITQLIIDYQWIEEKRLMALTWRDIDALKFDNVINTVCRSGVATKVFRGPKGEVGIFYKSNIPRRT